jgi:murein L,D-transpeptidase YcbB/YkuD
VKFVFPNDANVYLHSTPAPQLFRQSRRDFSHGCVRVEDPVALAEWALKSENGWTRDRIAAAMDGPRPLHVKLTRPIQVILFYITAAVMPDDGSIHFAQDIYGHDARLDRALRRSATALRGDLRKVSRAAIDVTTSCRPSSRRTQQLSGHRAERMDRKEPRSCRG